MAETIILTHIYLLMGCGFPLTASYILLSGGVFPNEWVIWSLAGVIVLGVGDSAAAILGKWYGRTKWRELSSKTQEGSSYFVIATSVVYYICIGFIDSKGNYLVSFQTNFLNPDSISIVLMLLYCGDIRSFYRGKDVPIRQPCGINVLLHSCDIPGGNIRR